MLRASENPVSIAISENENRQNGDWGSNESFQNRKIPPTNGLVSIMRRLLGIMALCSHINDTSIEGRRARISDSSCQTLSEVKGEIADTVNRRLQWRATF